MKGMRGYCIGFFLFIAVTMNPMIAEASDTVETFNIGVSNIESYLGFSGAGLSPSEQEVFGDLLIGFGLLTNLSGYFGTTLASNGYLADGTACLYLGVFGTPVDTDHFDLDLILDVSGQQAFFSQFGLTPAIELNIDIDPNMESFGGYMRVAEFLSGRRKIESGVEFSNLEEEYQSTLVTHIVFGIYYTLFPEHQVVLEYDMNINHTSQDGERNVSVGEVAFGYNVILSDNIEVISQVAVDIPQDDESINASAMIGFIATLPAASSTDFVEGSKLLEPI